MGEDPKFPDPKWSGIRGQSPKFIVDETESTRVDSADKKVRVRRELGICSVCGAAGGQVIKAYDDRVYEGLACAPCVLSGKASTFPPTHKAMRPIVFVARALRGDEPFASLLRAADIQSVNPREAQRLREKQAKRMGPVAVSPNRKAKRAAASKKGKRR